MFWNALAIVYGAFLAVFPERAIGYLTQILLAGYENPEDLEPSEWCVSIVRTKGILFVLAGVLAVGLEIVSDRPKETRDDGPES